MELQLRKALIYRVMDANDNRLQVQILPEMYGIPEEEMDNLPIYPMLQKGTMITGTSILEDKEHAEYVMVLTSKDYQVGYILCKMNDFGSGIADEKFGYSYGYKSIKNFLAGRRVLPSDFDYKNLVVDTFVSTDDGGFFRGYNRKTGDWFLINASGSMITVQQQDIFMRVGSPAPSPSIGPVAFSMIHLTSNKMLLKAPNIEFDCGSLILGKHGLKLGGVASMSPVIGSNGTNVQPISNISV